MKTIEVTLTNEEAAYLRRLLGNANKPHATPAARTATRKVGTALLRAQDSCARCGEYIWLSQGVWQDVTCGEGCADDFGRDGVHTP